MTTESPQVLIDIHISCSSLKNLDVGSKSDPMCVVYLSEKKIGDAAKRIEVGRTEVIKNNLNPNFQKTIRIPYRFEVYQELDFEVYDIDGSGVGDLKGDDLIGCVHTTVGDLVGKSSLGGFRQDLMHKGKEGKRGQLQAFAEEVHPESGEGGFLRMMMLGEHLDKKDLFGKSDPYVNIYRVVGGQRILIYKTEIIFKTLDPVWRPFSIPSDKLAGFTHPEETIVFECWDWDEHSSHDLIGEASVPLGDLMNPNIPISVVLQHPKKAGKRGYMGSGVIRFDWHFAAPKPTFLEFIQGGCRINLITSIDFTASNGYYSMPSSLHYHSPDSLNPYEQAITSVCNILLPYDSDGRISAFGFGARYPDDALFSCFPLNGNNENPEVVGVEGLLGVYRSSAKKLDYSGPTYFTDSIRRAIKICKEEEGELGSSYSILMIITDGEINDMDNTIEAIVDASKEAPLSIIIIGVGSCNFKNMEALDGDDGTLKSGKRVYQISRDIVQFVPFNKYADDPEMLAREVLAEIPSQLVSYMVEHNACPRLCPLFTTTPPMITPQP